MTNLKLVLRTYSALRQMSPDDIALLETLRALNDNDRELLVEMMTDKPTAKKAGKKAGKKSSKKSTRASSLGAAVKGRLQQREPTVGGFADDTDMLRCSDCGSVSDDNVHHKRTDPNYHPFVSTAPPAPAPSPANGASSATERSTRRPAPPSMSESDDETDQGASLSTANSRTQVEDASNVHHVGD